MKTMLYSISLACVLTLNADARISIASLARQAVSEEPATAQSAIKALNSMGPRGLSALQTEHAALLATYAKGQEPTDARQWERLKAAMEQVGGQKDCHASQLFWFDDLEKAKTEAARSGKPILSLRMLGKLTEELSCANSRFFRTTLYPNPEVSKYLRDNFVLHWQSVRPVPKVTIDFGDGRKLERTITGNSIHYVLHSDGTPIDALPGLYSAPAFLKALTTAKAAAGQYADMSPEMRRPFLAQYHNQQLSALNERRVADIRKVGGMPPRVAGFTVNTNAPEAHRPMNFALTKSAVELPLLNTTFVDVSQPGAQPRSWIELQMADPVWSKVAQLHLAEAKLDDSTFRLISSKNPSATDASRMAVTKSAGEDRLLRTITNLETSIAEDTVRNEYVLRPEIHRWFVNGRSTGNIDELNRQVYAELFLTPDTDPWLGLVPPNTFSAIENDGLVITR